MSDIIPMNVSYGRMFAGVLPLRKALSPILFDGIKSLKSCFVPRFIEMLESNRQPFKPLGKGDGTESIFDHTIKDIIVSYALIENKPAEIVIGKHSFPPAGYKIPTIYLAEIVKKAHGSLDLRALNDTPEIFEVMNIFILYHDIAKRTGDRADHEKKGAALFNEERAYFQKACSLSQEKLGMISFLIKWHGLYGQIDKAKRENTPLPTYDECLKELKGLMTSNRAKMNLLRILFMFNIAEGLQSDVFSRDFYDKNKTTDIITTFNAVSAQFLR
jgi:hypothetical protein